VSGRGGPSRRRAPPLLVFSGPSGAGKTRLLVRLIPALRARGLTVAVVKHTGHRHALDVRGKDTERLRRAGAVAAAIEGPAGLAWFGPPAGGPRALARLLPPCDLVLGEGWKQQRLARVEVHRRRVDGSFLCASDRGVVAVVTDEPPPRPLPTFSPAEVERLASWVVDWLRRQRRAAPRRRVQRR
jgi:molybdopterin-guanine dinucleotide biosynthesis protein B